MTDFLALGALLAFLAFVFSRAAGGFIAWLREEWRLLRMDSWATSDYVVNPSLGTRADPRVARVDLARRALGRRMRKQGRGLLGPRAKPYTPELRPPAPDPTPPKAGKVVPVRRSAT